MVTVDEAGQELPERRFGWWDMWVPEDEDPRLDGAFENTERAMLLGFLSDYRLTLEMKCSGLDPAGLAKASVPPSDLSLLGLVRHLAGVERSWFRRVLAGEEVPAPYLVDGVDTEFSGAAADPAVVEEAWATWRAEVANSEAFVAAHADLGWIGADGQTPLRRVLIHMIEEYARHCGHADLIRERIDGRVGQ
ncbi:DinB family protein [Occultella aeris]|uniref:DinB family protein n=1 Tax=Occultella aeris TaxID=2761496 RepID=A0A7M4DQ46_9MICO|nr:DinB family protein [Occultella aeris]VZO39590.1 hypothetical protein HALOF300_04284 [Occultella aeris]